MFVSVPMLARVRATMVLSQVARTLANIGIGHLTKIINSYTGFVTGHL